MSRVLIIKPSSLGDIIHSLPVCAALASRGHEVHFAARKEYHELLRMCRAVSRILDFPRHLSGIAPFLSDLRSRSYDSVLDLQGLFRSGLATALTRTSRRLGLPDAREGALFFYDEVAAYPPGIRHAIDRYWSALGLLDGASAEIGLSSTIDYGLDVPAAASAEAQALTGGPDYIVFSPLARQERKMIRADVWPTLAEILTKRGTRVVVVGSGQSMPAFGPGVIDLVNRTPLAVLCAVIRGAGMCVSVDSAPMHLAAAFGVPVVAMFGPTDPAMVGPYTSRRMILRSDEPRMRDLTCEGIAAVVLSEFGSYKIT